MRAMTGVLCAVTLVPWGGAIGAGETKATVGPARRGAAVLSGRCHCGAVAFEVRSPVVKSSYCDCRGCQRATGALKAPYVTVRRVDFRVTAGKPASYRVGSAAPCDRNGTWQFCRRCGAPLFWKPNQGDNLDVFAAAFDDPSVFRPAE